MSGHDDHSFTARLAAQRLTRPGVLDRTPIERTYERVQQGSVTHELTERLRQRAAASGEAGASSFVWRRSAASAGASAEGLTAPAAPGVPTLIPSVPVVSATPISKSHSRTVQRSALPEAESAAVTARLMSRAQSPGVLAMGSTISRPAAPGSLNNVPAFAAHLQSRYGATPSDGAPATPVPAAPVLSISRAPAGVVRRQADSSSPTASPSSSHDSASVVPASSRASRAIAAAPMPPHHAPAVTAMAGTLPLAGTRSLAAADSRNADSSRVADLPMTPAARPLLSAGSAAGGPLVLRRKLATPAQSSTTVPAVLPPAVVQLPREETPSASQRNLEPLAAQRLAPDTGSDIDRITEEVGRRLMRRLQIERERRGIRQWR